LSGRAIAAGKTLPYRSGDAEHGAKAREAALLPEETTMIAVSTGRLAAGLVLAAALTGLSPTADAQQVSRGALIAQTCSGCHAADFKGAAGVMPTLRGRPAAELATAMTEFRSGARYSTVMGRLARGLTDDEITAVTGYLANLK
jgi:sulfide dehydrogenase cytochrome subunit